MLSLTCVMRGQFDPAFIYKDEHKSEQDFKIKSNMYTDTEMQFQWAMHKLFISKIQLVVYQQCCVLIG